MDKTLLLAFIVPLRHPASSRNWGNVVTRLGETLRSIAACTRSGNCIGILVANTAAEIPPVPEGIIVLRTDAPPPPVSVFFGETDDAVRRAAVWRDKGTKVALGAIHAKQRGAKYIMTVDADDLISNQIPDYVRRHSDEPGWYVRSGVLLPVGRRIGLIIHDFYAWCGTYAIVRTDLLPLRNSPGEMDPEIVSLWLGHHRELIPALSAAGQDLKPLPFEGAVYRTGHTDGNYQRGSLIKEAFNKEAFKRGPIRFFKRMRWLRYFSIKHARIFLDGTRPA